MKHMTIAPFALRTSACLLAASLFLPGCQSYDIVQKNVFADDDGNVVVVSYGRSGSDHVNTFVSPVTGEELEFKSKLMVKIELPDGDTFKAWQCMNFLAKGTMYQTDDREWKVLVVGFSAVIYHQTDEKPPRYLEVFRGVICDTPKMDVKRDERWKDVLRHGREYRRPKPVQQTTR